MVATIIHETVEKHETLTKKVDSTVNQSKQSKPHHSYDKLYALVWKCIKSFMNLIVFIVGFINNPFSAKKRIPWDDEDPRISLVPIEQLVAKIKSGDITSTQVVSHYVKRIQRVNPLINAVIDVASDEALKEAAVIDQGVRKIINGEPDADLSLLEKPLLGIPFSCKDSIGVKGMLQTAGSFHRKGQVAQNDAAVISALRSKGAIPLAITNVPEILLWWECNNVLYGESRNPHDLSRITGGSSGGEASLVAVDSIPFGVGSDMGGSIRIPSFYCGIFGHKTSPRLISTKGMWPEFPEPLNDFISFGPIARNMSDLKLTLKCMLSESMRGRVNLDKPVDMSRIRIMWMIEEPGNPLTTPVSDEVKVAIEDAVHALVKKHGISEKKVSFPALARTLEMWSIGIREADERSVQDLLEQVSGEKINVNVELFKSVLGLSKFSFNALFLCNVQKVLDAPTGSARFDKFKNAMKRLKQKVLQSLGDDGVLICSTMPETAPKHCSTPFKGTDTSLVGAANLLGLPATQVPIRISSDGLPIGLQVASAPYNDHLCLAVAESLEEIFGGYKRP